MVSPLRAAIGVGFCTSEADYFPIVWLRRVQAGQVTFAADHHLEPSAAELVAEFEEDIRGTLDAHAPIKLIDHSQERHGAEAEMCTQ